MSVQKSSLLFIKCSVFALGLALVGCQKADRALTLDTYDGQAIVNGTVADGKEPWARSVVGIGSSLFGGSPSIYCSGTIINEKTIVTAAHCVEAIKDSDVIVFGLTEDGDQTQTRKVARKQLHESYQTNFPDSSRDVFDVGIVEFEGGLPEGYFAAEFLADDTVLKDGTEIMLAGFGVTNGGMQSGSGILRYTKVLIVEAAYGKTEVRTNEANNGSCSGDSGGPGFIEVDGKFFLWGATSRGDAYCREEGVYTKVTAYKSWIDTTLATWASNPAKKPGEEQPAKPGRPTWPGEGEDDDWGMVANF